MFLKISTRKIIVIRQPPPSSSGTRCWTEDPFVRLRTEGRTAGERRRRRRRRTQGKDGISSCLHLFRRTEEGWQESEVPALRLKFTSMSFHLKSKKGNSKKHHNTRKQLVPSWLDDGEVEVEGILVRLLVQLREDPELKQKIM